MLGVYWKILDICYQMGTEIFKIEEEITEKMKPPKWAEFTSYNMDSFDVPLNFHDLQLKQTFLQITLFLLTLYISTISTPISIRQGRLTWTMWATGRC